MDRAAYLSQLQALMPQGGAWPRDPDAVLTTVLDLFAAELARVDGQSAELVTESHPPTTLQLLPDWERVAGLPDPCTGPAETLSARRARVAQKLSATGGQSPAYFIAVAAALGYAVTVEEFVPFRAGQNRAGDAVRSEVWWFAWLVRAPETTVTPFRAGQSTAGEPLRSWGVAGLECVIRRLAPAHTFVLFAYGEA